MRTIKKTLDKERPYEVAQSKTHEIGRFKIVQDTLSIGGQEYPYSYIWERDCACVLPIYQGKIVLIRQYRHSVNEWLLELPCGQIEEGEAPAVAAVRELGEETGLSVEKLTPLGSSYMRAGVSTGRAYLYLAECGELLTPHLDGAELIEVQFHTPAELDALEARGDFSQLLGLVCWHWAKKQIGGKNAD
ncbi:NUDIX hydrolase [Oscillibacter sp.]|uniref:NUDIX hydrolase n=1 Tax=Oscillibacter sp. TaxID=1945593 RepID=UPI0028AF6ED0|nr:NUDIX hydrolase [Oscillibacter sp.]